MMLAVPGAPPSPSSALDVALGAAIVYSRQHHLGGHMEALVELARAVAPTVESYVRAAEATETLDFRRTYHLLKETRDVFYNSEDGVSRARYLMGRSAFELGHFKEAEEYLLKAHGDCLSLMKDADFQQDCGVYVNGGPAAMWILGSICEKVG
eukprot:Selendium_serpulae@DN4860_c0_g1_i4.p2